MYLICDIDGTLSVEPIGRRVAALYEDWDIYYSMDFSLDAPRPGVVNMVNSLIESGWIAFFVTNRRDTVRDETWSWIRRHVPNATAANATLVMRKCDDFTDPSWWKVDSVRRVCPKASAGLVIDDDHHACLELGKMGYTVLEVM